MNFRTPFLSRRLHFAMLLFPALLFGFTSTGQDSSGVEHLISLPEKFLSGLDKKTANFENGLAKSTGRYFSKLLKQEKRLKRKLLKKDSILANKLFPENIEEKYRQVQNLASSPGGPSSYSGHLDSLATALKFLKLNSVTGNPQLEAALEQYRRLQDQVNLAEQAKTFVQERQALLKEQFQQLGMIKELRQFRRQAYYYQAQIREYREIFEDPSKMEAKLIELAMKVPAFKEFFARNSMLGSMFALPDADATGAGLQGLQTRASLNQLVADRFGSGAGQMLQQNIQSAQSQLGELKSRLDQFSEGVLGNTSSEIDAPDFKPNSQKTKSFLRRLELGTNLQSQKARYFFPVTSDLGLSLGYKLNDKSIAGIGASGKIGWGRGWDSVRVSYEGLGLRSFIDWQLKGGLYASGGFEMNYRGTIRTVQQLQDRPAWQQSGLLGLSKKYTISKKLKGDIRLLWDFLSYRQVPVTQPVVFRIGYQFK